MKLIATLFVMCLFCGSICLAQNWRVFNESNSGVPQNNITAIAFDQDGLAWIGTKDRGLATFDGTTWATFDTAIYAATCQPNITDISINPLNNDVWVTAQNLCGVLQFERASSSWISHGFLFNTGLRCVEIDSEGVVWIGNEANGGLFRYDGASFESFNEINSDNPNDYVYSVGIINDSQRWVAGTHGIGLMDDNNGWTKLVGDTITPGFPAFAIFGDAIVESDSVSWFSYKDGLLKFHTDSSKRKNYNPQNSIIPSDNCFTIYRSLDIDASGNKWMTSCGGLLKFDGVNWEIFNTSNSGIPSNEISAIEVDSNNNIWLGTRLHGLVLFEPNTSTAIDNGQELNPPGAIIYPNPAKDYFQVMIHNGLDYQLKIYDLHGKCIMKKESLKHTESLDMTNFSSGVYNIVFENDAHFFTKKIVLQ